jgi:hypothetical protein
MVDSLPIFEFCIAAGGVKDEANESKNPGGGY